MRLLKAQRWVTKGHIDQAMTAIRNGASPNALSQNLFAPPQDLATEPEWAWTFLHLMVRKGNHQVVQELLERGASPHASPDQPCNLMAMALSVLAGELMDLMFDVSTPSITIHHPTLAMINLLAAHGLRCDPQSLEQENRNIHPVTLDIAKRDPMAILATISRSLTHQQFEDISQALLEWGGDPEPALLIMTSWPRDNQKPNTITDERISCLRALADRRQLRQLTQSLSNPAPPSKKM